MSLSYVTKTILENELSRRVSGCKLVGIDFSPREWRFYITIHVEKGNYYMPVAVDCIETMQSYDGMINFVTHIENYFNPLWC